MISIGIGDEISATIYAEVVELRTIADIPGAVIELQWPRIDSDGVLNYREPLRMWVALDSLTALRTT